MIVIALQSCTFSNQFKETYNKIPYKQNDNYEAVCVNNFLTLVANTIACLLQKIYSQDQHQKLEEKRGIFL
jgi:hypothetical protein